MTNKEAVEVLEDMKVTIDIPKAAELQRKRNDALDMAVDALREQPIRCKDCKHWEGYVGTIANGHGDCKFHEAHFVTRNGYCFWAERRINDE